MLALGQAVCSALAVPSHFPLRNTIWGLRYYCSAHLTHGEGGTETLEQLAQGHTAAEGRAGAQRGHPVLGGKATPPTKAGGGAEEAPCHQGVRVTIRRPGLESQLSCLLTV